MFAEGARQAFITLAVYYKLPLVYLFSRTGMFQNTCLLVRNPGPWPVLNYSQGSAIAVCDDATLAVSLGARR